MLREPTDQWTQLGASAFNGRERMPQRGFVDAVAERELQEPSESILIRLHLLNPGKSFECLPARDVGVENRPPQNLVSVEPAASTKRLELLDVLVAKTNRDSILEPLRSPHGSRE